MKNLSQIFFLHPSGLIQTAKEIKPIFARSTNDTGVVNKLNEQRVVINWLCGFLHHLFTHPGGPTCKNESFVRAFCQKTAHSVKCQARAELFNYLQLDGKLT